MIPCSRECVTRVGVTYSSTVYTNARETTQLMMVDEQSKARLHVPLDILVPVICIYLLFHSYYLIITILVYTFTISVQNFELFLGLDVC